MIYVYDLLVNMNKEFIDFYDWDDLDNYEHIRKCLLIKISKEDYYNVFSNSIKIDSSIMSEIKGKTQKYSGKNIVIENYMLAITDGNNAMILKFDKNGIIKEKSKLLINEEVEIINLSNNLKISEFKYEIVSKNKMNNMTRKERQVTNIIINELSSIKDDKSKIDYLYYEWFETNKGDNKYKRLIDNINKEYTNKHKEFLSVLNLIANK